MFSLSISFHQYLYSHVRKTISICLLVLIFYNSQPYQTVFLFSHILTMFIIIPEMHGSSKIWKLALRGIYKRKRNTSSHSTWNVNNYDHEYDSLQKQFWYFLGIKYLCFALMVMFSLYISFVRTYQYLKSIHSIHL